MYIQNQKIKVPEAQVSHEVLAGLANVPAAHCEQVATPAALMWPKFNNNPYRLLTCHNYYELHSKKFLHLTEYKNLH